MKINTFWYILFYLIKKCLNYIVYPLKVYDELNQIENFLLFNSTYTTIEMGTPPQKVNFYFSLNHDKMNLTDIGCKDINLYDIEESDSSAMLGYPDEDEDSYSSKVFAMDTVYFYDNINLTKKVKNDKYFMYYYSYLNKEENNICGSIGLAKMKYESYDEEPDEIEYYLKYLRNQNNYFSFFHYNGQDYIVNGIFLNQEFKEIFHDVQNISWINPIMGDNFCLWEISMKEIFYNNTHNKDNIIFELNPLFELIIGTNDFKSNILNDFFNFYINKKICLLNEINGYHIIQCNGEEFGKTDIKLFPNLFMYNSNINYIFEMIGEELFIKLNNIYYFGIIFPIENYEYNKWVIGKLFMRKYPVIFSPMNRLVGFYVDPNDDDYFFKEDIKDEKTIEKAQKRKKANKTNNKIFISDKNLYLKIIIIALIFTCLGLYIGRKLFLQRRKRTNELTDDYYQYDAEINSNNKKEIKKNYQNSSYNSIEMYSKI